MLKICVIGAEGLVGSGIFKSLDKCPEYDVYAVNRKNIFDFNQFACDVLINSNGSGKKGWCNSNPIKSMEINCISTYEYMKRFIPKRYILISSVDVYPIQDDINLTHESKGSYLNLPSSTYGFHKIIAENIIKQFYPDHLIIRLPGLLSPNIKKNVVYDIANNRPLFISPYSNLNFISINDVSNFVSKFVLESPFAIINCASKSSISIKEIIKIAKKENQYEDKDFKNLPIQNYQISTKLLNDFFQTKDSIFYIEEFFRYFKNQI